MRMAYLASELNTSQIMTDLSEEIKSLMLEILISVVQTAGPIIAAMIAIGLVMKVLNNVLIGAFGDGEAGGAPAFAYGPDDISDLTDMDPAELEQEILQSADINVVYENFEFTGFGVDSIHSNTSDENRPTTWDNHPAVDIDIDQYTPPADTYAEAVKANRKTWNEVFDDMDDYYAERNALYGPSYDW